MSKKEKREWKPIAYMDNVYRYIGLTKLKLALSKGKGINDEVWKDLDKAIEINKGNWKNHLAKAEACILTNQNEQAKQFLDETLKLNPVEPDKYHFYALYYEGIGDKEKAKEYHELANKYGYIKEPDEE